MTYSIGEFSKRVQLSIDTLRYYEKEKLIQPKRNKSNRRLYSEKDVSWIAFIKKLKQIGMPIKEIKHYSHLRYQGDDTIEERMALLERQNDALLKQKEEIEQNISFLNKKTAIYKEMLVKRDN